MTRRRSRKAVPLCWESRSAQCATGEGFDSPVRGGHEQSRMPPRQTLAAQSDRQWHPAIDVQKQVDDQQAKP